jgi:hypothetical protein
VAQADDGPVLEESALYGVDDTIELRAVQLQVERAAELGCLVGLFGMVEGLVVAFEAVNMVASVVRIPTDLMNKGRRKQEMRRCVTCRRSFGHLEKYSRYAWFFAEKDAGPEFGLRDVVDAMALRF